MRFSSAKQRKQKYKNLSRLRKLLLYFLFMLTLLVLGLFFLGYFYKDNIITAFVQNANKHLNTKVEPRYIDITIFKSFPHVSLQFNHVKIHESIEGSDNTCLEARRIYFTFNFYDLLNNDYKIKELVVENADLNFYKKKNGKINYQIFKNTNNEAQDTSSISLDLDHIVLKNVGFSYADSTTYNAYTGYANKARAGFHYAKKSWDIDLSGNFDIKSIEINRLKYFRNKKVKLSAQLMYNNKRQSFLIKPSQLNIDQGTFKVAGQYRIKENDSLDIHISASKSSFRSIMSLLPAKYTKKMLKYKSHGNIYFKGRIKGLTGNGHTPKVMVKFGCKDARFTHPDYDAAFKHANLEGKFYNGGESGMRNGYINLNNIKGKLKDKAVKGAFKLSNFKKPYLDFKVNGGTSFSFLVNFTNLRQIHAPGGDIDVNMSFKGPLEAIKNPKKYKNKLRSTGEIQIKNMNFRYKQMAYKNFNGNFLFNENDLSAADFTGKIGSSDFEINGLFKNVFTYLLTDQQPIMIDAVYKADFLNLDEILQNGQPSEKDTNAGKYKFQISPRIAFNLQVNIDKVQFRRFDPDNIKGFVSLQEQVAKAKDVSMDIAGGNIWISSKLNARNPGFIRFDSKTIFRNVSTSKAFYMFENFGQSFFTSKNIKGNINATINSTIVMDQYLNIKGPELKADIDASIFNGRLYDVKPLQSLSSFVNKEALADIRFSKLKNHIRIEHGVVHIPKMEINSNINNMTVRGMHTFDNHFDYHIRLPVKNYKNIGKDAKIATSKDNEGGLNLFLRIKGTPEDYEVTYDKDAVKSKIRQRYDEEKEEIKEALKEDPLNEKEKSQELEEDEYFEFED